MDIAAVVVIYRSPVGPLKAPFPERDDTCRPGMKAERDEVRSLSECLHSVAEREHNSEHMAAQTSSSGSANMASLRYQAFPNICCLVVAPSDRPLRVPLTEVDAAVATKLDVSTLAGSHEGMARTENLSEGGAHGAIVRTVHNQKGEAAAMDAVTRARCHSRHVEKRILYLDDLRYPTYTSYLFLLYEGGTKAEDAVGDRVMGQPARHVRDHPSEAGPCA